MSSSFQEAVFQNNCLVRQIIDYLLIDGPVHLLHLALINKKFNEEICSRLRQIQHLEFFSIKPEQPSNSDNDTEDEKVNEEEEVVESLPTQYGLNQILCDNLTIFNSNLSFITHQSPIISLDFIGFNGCDDDCVKLDSLLRLKGIQSMKFHPSQRHSSNDIYYQMIDKNLPTLKSLIHPPENFFKSLLHDDTCLKLDYLEIDIAAFRSMSYGIRESEDVYLFEVQEEFEAIIEKKIKVKSLTLHGHNCARFQSFYTTLLTESNVTTLKMICNEPIITSEDLMIFQEWKNRNKRFPLISDFEVIFWNDALINDYDTAMTLLFEVFPNLKKIKLGSQKGYSADECFEMIESIQKYWKKNTFEKCEHYIHLNTVIPKEHLNNFELRLMTHKSYRNLSKSCEIWFYTMRINIQESIEIKFLLL
jgi:hypothetical protein